MVNTNVFIEQRRHRPLAHALESSPQRSGYDMSQPLPNICRVMCDVLQSWVDYWAQTHSLYTIISHDLIVCSVLPESSISGLK